MRLSGSSIPHPEAKIPAPAVSLFAPGVVRRALVALTLAALALVVIVMSLYFQDLRHQAAAIAERFQELLCLAGEPRRPQTWITVVLAAKTRLPNLKLAADQPHQFNSLGHDVTAALSIFKTTTPEENGIDEGHLPPSGPFPVEATLGHRISVTREAGAGSGFYNFHLFHFPAGNERDKYRNDTSVYHDASGAVTQYGANSSVICLISSRPQ